MNISLNSKILNVIVTVLIVEDDVNQAFNLKRIIESYQSTISGVKDIHENILAISYYPIINGIEQLSRESFRGNEDYLNSVKYLKQNISSVDVILCDHHLSNSFGDKFLKEVYDLERQLKVRTFKVLHSVHADNQEFQRESFVDFVCDAKSQETINKITLKNFEARILQKIFFGNPHYHFLFTSFIHNRNFAADDLFLNGKISGIPRASVLFINAMGGGNNRLTYLSPIYIPENISRKFVLDEYADNDLFLRISKALYVNRLWLSDVNLIKDEYKFITRGDIDASYSLSKKSKKSGVHKSRYLDFLVSILPKNDKAILPNMDFERYFKP